MFFTTECMRRSLKIIGLLLLCSLFFSVLAGGCRQRRPIDVPPRVERVAELGLADMRVLVAEADSFEISFDGSFHATAPNGRVQTFVKRPVPVKAAVLNGSITINNVSFGSEVSLSRYNNEFLELDGRRYRGSLNLHLSGSGRISAVNVLSVEHYIAGVISAEMPASWEIEALKVQAVAARTYSLYVRQTAGTGRNWDVRSTQADQVYRGIEAESPRIWGVVEQTGGQVLICPQSDIRYGLFPAYFSSTCGGHTFNASDVFGDNFEPLKGVRCPHCEKTAPKRHYSWQDVVIPKKELFEKLCQKYPNLKELGELKTVKVSGYVQHGQFYKFTRVDLIGTSGKSNWLRGEDFRFIVGASSVKSTACRIEDTGSSIRFHSARGYGHNVGMCQYGAQAMAREGKNYKEILDFYYPGAVLKGLY